jgi:hypothetical protein
MTAIINSNTKIGQYSIEEVNAKFLSMLPLIQKTAVIIFSKLTPDKRADAIQNTIAWSLDMLHNLARQGRLDEAFASPLAWFGIRRHKEGRIAGTPSSITDVMAEGTLGLGRTKVRQFWHEKTLYVTDDNRDSEENGLKDFRNPDAERTTSFYLDFDAWFEQQSERDRKIILALMRGDGTNEVSRQFGCTAGRISQLRKRFEKSWNEFIADERELVTA